MSLIFDRNNPLQRLANCYNSSRITPPAVPVLTFASSHPFCRQCTCVHIFILSSLKFEIRHTCIIDLFDVCGFTFPSDETTQ